MDAHMKTVKLSFVAAEIAPVLDDAISKSPSLRREESQTENLKLTQHLQWHRHHKYGADRPRVREDCSSRRTSRQTPVGVSARTGVRHR
jgi:hypothetical protein